MKVSTAKEKQLINEKLGETLKADLRALDARLDGDLFFDTPRRWMYATDASAYRELPLAVCRPKNEQDVRELTRFARNKKITLIPRAAGTSLAGQVVGRGLVVDISRYMTAILDFSPEKRRVKVQPGVVPDELNRFLEPYGLFFSPETSTSNRCMIGGMIGNNSSGLHSLVYGTTREHIRSLRMVLADGSGVEFGPVDEKTFHEKCGKSGIEGDVYRFVRDKLGEERIRNAIINEFPDPRVKRRNTGYALDELLDCGLFSGAEASQNNFNFCRLIAGSEGTLGMITEATLELDPLPPPEKALVPVHMRSVKEAIQGNLVALRHSPSAVELMDRTILDLTRENLTQRKNRFFVKDHPGAILIVEMNAPTPEVLQQKIDRMIADFEESGLGYHFPVVRGGDIPRVWALRKAGLGVLSKMEGDAKPVSVIEDTSVVPEKLEEYIDQFNGMLDKYGLECVYHAHISVGELHLRPLLNLKDPEHVKLFHTLAGETARLVKSFGGSLSGEHGDGRLRGEFIPLMVGNELYELMRELKQAWDPQGVFNRGKITDTPPMNTSLRYRSNPGADTIETIFDFKPDGGMMRHIEQCNGSGDCRKTEVVGGTMCPSYMATREEWTTTRARANMLREFIASDPGKDPFDHPEIYEVLDLCLSCKACKSECPSSVDMAKLKAEFLQHWYDKHGIPLRTRMIAYITSINKLGSLMPSLFNYVATSPLPSNLLKKVLGFATDRSIPTLAQVPLRKWARRHLDALNNSLPDKAPEVVYFADEFTEYNDTAIGITAIRLLNRLGFRVIITGHGLSGRTFISKGLLRTARKHARKCVRSLAPLVNDERPLVGTEPSAILGFRDEFPELVGKDMKEQATRLSKNALMIEEFLMEAFKKKQFTNEVFTKSAQHIKLHGHCQQKAVASTRATLELLALPDNYTVEEIPSGCCGMAGSFGYEKEHYDVAMNVGELVLFPAVRQSEEGTLIAAPGTSCRHQIKDGTGARAWHPVEILYKALI